MQLTNKNGKIDFDLESSPPKNFNFEAPVFISNIRPGMSKYFMVITQDQQTSDPSYIRVQPDHEANPEEFTFTWFDKILPILGNFSTKISVKEMPLLNMPESDGYFEIRDYKFIKKNGKNKILISVI